MGAARTPAGSALKWRASITTLATALEIKSRGLDPNYMESHEHEILV